MSTYSTLIVVHSFVQCRPAPRPAAAADVAATATAVAAEPAPPRRPGADWRDASCSRCSSVTVHSRPDLMNRTAVASGKKNPRPDAGWGAEKMRQAPPAADGVVVVDVAAYVVAEATEQEAGEHWRQQVHFAASAEATQNAVVATWNAALLADAWCVVCDYPSWPDSGSNLNRHHHSTSASEAEGSRRRETGRLQQQSPW